MALVNGESHASADVAYLAGFFDGEGCVYILRQRRRNKVGDPAVYYCLEISFTNSHMAPLDLAMSMFGGRISESKDPRPGTKRVHRLRIRSRQALAALTEMRPFLRVKLQHADIAVTFQTALSSGLMTDHDAERMKAAITVINDKAWNAGRMAGP
jgi:hypothetical protein